jgi:hypothetical protein
VRCADRVRRCLFTDIGNVMKARPAGQSVTELAYAIGKVAMGAATVGDVMDPAEVVLLARINADTDTAFYDVATDPVAGYWSDSEVDAVVAGVRSRVHVLHGDPTAGSIVTEADLGALTAAGIA